MHTHETQSRRESCVFSFHYLILYTALHKRVLSTLKQCLLQFLTIINNNNNNNNNNMQITEAVGYLLTLLKLAISVIQQLEFKQ